MVVLTDEFDNNLSNANFCNSFDDIPQILRVKASTVDIMNQNFHSILLINNNHNSAYRSQTKKTALK